MKYKALMLDVDGTTVPYDYSALPSDTVATAIHEAQKVVDVCIVTGRSFASIGQILAKLNMHSGFAVVNNGAHVINIEKKEILHEQSISKEDTAKIISIFRKEKIPFSIKSNPFEQEHIKHPEQKIPDEMSASMFFTDEDYSSEKVDEILHQLSPFSYLSTHKTHHRHPNKFGLLITHIDATKQNGIYHLEKYLSITREEMIGVGDSYNDFPLLMACGLKVAMGNAIPELKEIADYIAPSVNDDGVADVIKKFILNY